MWCSAYQRKKQNRTISASERPRNSGSPRISSSRLLSRSSSTILCACRSLTAGSRANLACTRGRDREAGLPSVSREGPPATKRFQRATVGSSRPGCRRVAHPQPPRMMASDVSNRLMNVFGPNVTLSGWQNYLARRQTTWPAVLSTMTFRRAEFAVHTLDGCERKNSR